MVGETGLICQLQMTHPVRKKVKIDEEEDAEELARVGGGGRGKMGKRPIHNTIEAGISDSDESVERSEMAESQERMHGRNQESLPIANDLEDSEFIHMKNQLIRS